MSTKKLTTEDFIQRCKDLYPEANFDYTNTKYNGNRHPVTVNCPIHGDFSIGAKRFLKGFTTQCPKCPKPSVDYTQEDFLKESLDIHGDVWDYTEVVFINKVTPVKLTCKVCNTSYEKKPVSHLKGLSCDACTRKAKGKLKTLSKTQVLDNLTSKFPDITFSLVGYEKVVDKVSYKCNKHDTDYSKPYEELIRMTYPCQECYKDSLKERPLRYKTKTIINEFRKVHGDLYDYSEVDYKGGNDKVTIICPDHDKFYITPSSHKFGNRCKYCNNHIKDTDHYISKCQNTLEDIWDYSDTVYTTIDSKITVKCKKCGTVKHPTASAHLRGTGCPKCAASSIISKLECEVYDYIKSIYDYEVKQSVRGLIGRKELDIYIPDKNLAIEFNGLYWHSSGEISTDSIKKSHIEKTVSCEDLDINLLHIFENEWIDPIKQDIWKSVISNKLGITPNKVYARNTKLFEINNTEANTFCENNHIQGSCKASVKYGLYYKDELVCVATFSKARFDKDLDTYELIRLCSKKYTNIVGGASKLIKHFIRNFPDVRLISYANRRWSQGGVYSKSGFKLINTSKPCYFYYKDANKNLEHRSKYQKHKLPKLLSDFNPNLSEAENMYNSGYRRIWDCGNLVYEYCIEETKK